MFVWKDIKASSCHFKGTPKKFIGSMRGKFGGEITERITLADSQSELISRWDWRMAQREGLWGTGRAGEKQKI